MDFKRILLSVEERFGEYLTERQPQIVENQDNFIARLHTYEDPDTGFFILTHGMSPDLVAFEKSIKEMSRWNRQYQSISDVAYSADGEFLLDTGLQQDEMRSNKDILRCF